ncbi:ribosome maturation factor RimM [Lactobacillus xylocopicola]|uniref:Ribosome maturation factor RimM n=1 Tax=Lactobacillus xylocopicola TaxID=2976676 RepID=A0ABN6SK21_9LACO|nr:ribosome maturation factor RimM [Lactobacillus xylocopicola]BDR60655.1 ribosome maturation factor RimM [Lactobacillus xylocopicola]
MQFYDVAQILTTHGLKGELKVKLVTDFPAERFTPGQQLALKDDPERILTVASSRPFQQFWLVSFAEVAELAAAAELKGKMLVVSEADQHELPEDAYYYHDILGCTVVDQQSGAPLGKITGIESPGANDVWEVTEKNGHTYLIPYIDEVVKQVDVPGQKIYVELLEGLRDED